MESWSFVSEADNSRHTLDTQVEDEFSMDNDNALNSNGMTEKSKHQHSTSLRAQQSCALAPSARASVSIGSSSKIRCSSSNPFSPRIHMHKASLVPKRSILVSSQADSCEGKRLQIKRVFFSTTEIREYEQILGDNPWALDGPPVSLGWRYDADKILFLTVDDYERCVRRQTVRRSNVAPWVSADILPRHEREGILLDAGYTQSQLAAAIRAKRKIKNQRQQTLVNLKAAKMEEIMEGIRRKLRKMIVLPGRNFQHTMRGRRHSNEYNVYQ